MNERANMIWSPAAYEQAAFLLHELGQEMLARLALMQIAPKLIVDAGAGVGQASKLLQEKFPSATIISLDHNEEMLRHQAQPDIAKVCADAARMPLPAQSVDMIFANFILPWADDKQAMLHEWRRVLKPNGLLMFTSLGIDTLRECPKVKTIPGLIDMHDLGDALVQTGFADPVMDVDYYTLNYQKRAQLIEELRALNMITEETALANWPANHDSKWQITYEIIFGHCWMPEETNTVKLNEQGEGSFSLAQLRKQLRGG